MLLPNWFKDLSLLPPLVTQLEARRINHHLLVYHHALYRPVPRPHRPDAGRGLALSPTVATMTPGQVPAAPIGHSPVDPIVGTSRLHPEGRAYGYARSVT